MGVYQELATGIGILCFLDHLGQIVDSLSIVLIDSVQSICLNENAKQIGDVVDDSPVAEDTAIGEAAPQQHAKKEEW